MASDTKNKKLKFPTIVVLLLALSFAFGGATTLVNYASGKEVAYSPKMLMVSHTEYRFAETGQIIARLVDFQGNPVTVQNCTASILYPDKTYFVQDQLMATSSFSGDYWYNFTTPNGPEGTYEYQAVCTYAAGAKTASVTNSFHLSGAFNFLLNNVTNIQEDLDGISQNLTYVANNLTQLSTDVFAINESLSADIAGVSTQVSDLSTQLNANISTVLAEFGDIQSNFSTVLTELDNIDTALTNNFADIQSNFSTVFDYFADIQSNFTEVFNRFDSVDLQLADLNNTLNTQFANINTNFSQVLEAIDAIDINVTVLEENQAQILANLTEVLANQVQINTTVNAISTDLANFRTVYDGNISIQNAYLAFINETTTSTYDYVTGTLAVNIDQVLTDIGVINATVNRIETTTTQINSTVTDILTNQEDEVHMSVFSG